MDTKDNKSFGFLFRELRFKAGIFTLSQFARLLEEEGYYYEESIFSHWQQNRRIPYNRSLLIAIIKLFIKNNAISVLDEANLFLEAARQGYLTDNEKSYLNFDLFGRSRKEMAWLETDFNLTSYNIEDSTSKLWHVENQINLLYQKIYEGYPSIVFKKLTILLKLIRKLGLDKTKKGLSLISRIHWVRIRCLSDMCSPDEFKKSNIYTARALSFAIEKNTEEIGPTYWVKSAIKRLELITAKTKPVKKNVEDCLNDSLLAFKHTAKENVTEKITEAVEIAKIALILRDSDLFERYLDFAFSIISNLPSDFKYLGAVVWDIKARGNIKFNKSLESALAAIEIAKTYSSNKSQAINLYLGNTKLQSLRLSKDKNLNERAKNLEEELSLLAQILDNPYQSLRATNKGKFVGI
jgi:hypothetical protein